MINKSKQYCFWVLLLMLVFVPSLVFGQSSCGEKIPALENFELISQYSLGLAVVLMIPGILFDHKFWKKALLFFALIPFAGWMYVNFFVDYNKLKKDIFNFNAVAEATLANIAEAQDRYKSEQSTYIGDLRKIYSHIGGAGGMNECVKILNVKAGVDHWRAEAGHVSSPDTVIWDSRAGTSLKKG
jgi:hypothetical protein